MKKAVAILLVLIIVLLALTLGRCVFDNKLDPEINTKLREDYSREYGYEMSSEELEKWYCGTYRGNIAFYPWGQGFYCALMTVNIAGIKYTYADSRQVLIYSDGEFYTMPVAYDMDLIGYFDIYAIFSRHDLNEMLDRQF